MDSSFTQALRIRAGRLSTPRTYQEDLEEIDWKNLLKSSTLEDKAVEWTKGTQRPTVSKLNTPEVSQMVFSML